MDIISLEIFNSLCKICKEHGWYMPEENFRTVYKNIEEMCNKMLEKGYVLEQTIVVVVNDVNENKVIFIFAEY